MTHPETNGDLHGPNDATKDLQQALVAKKELLECSGEKSDLLDIAGLTQDTLFKVPTLLCLTQVVEGREKDISSSKSGDV